jgi:hypothetical protein
VTRESRPTAGSEERLMHRTWFKPGARDRAGIAEAPAAERPGPGQHDERGQSRARLLSRLMR